MFHATPGMHGEIARQHQQTLLDDARSVRRSERAPHRTGLRVITVALIACLGVGAIGLSQSRAATLTRTAAQTAKHTNAHAADRLPISRHLAVRLRRRASPRARSSGSCAGAQPR